MSDSARKDSKLNLNEKLDWVRRYLSPSPKYRPEKNTDKQRFHALMKIYTGGKPDGGAAISYRQWQRYLIDEGIPPIELLRSICLMYPGLRVEHLEMSSLKDMSEAFGGLIGARDKVQEDSEFYFKNRRTLADFIKPYYTEFDKEPDFPLIVDDGWLEKEPVKLTPEMDKALLDDDAAEWNSVAPTPNELPGINEPYHSMKARLNPDSPFFDGDSYRILQVSRRENHVSLKCGISSYFKYQDDLEALGAELAGWYRGSSAQGTIRPKPDGTDIPLRGAASEIFNLRHRSAVAGQNILLAVRNHKGTDSFYLHRRTNVQEAYDTIHVCPAGTFAPEREGDGLHERDFSLRRNALREFAEELLRVPEAREAANTLKTFSSYPDIKQFIQLFDNNEHVTIYHLGLGLDPVTTKPELLACMIIDMNMVDNASKVKFEEVFEGKSFPVQLRRSEIRKWRYNPRMLPAGAACLEMVDRFYPELFDRYD